MPTKTITMHVLDLAQNQEIVVEVEREAEAESAIIQTWAKLQNTPQLIYMCREALKIEA